MGSSKALVLTFHADGLVIDHVEYRPPRRLGAARSLNLGLAWAASNGYEAVLCLPPGASLAGGTADVMAAVAQSDPTIAWVVPWTSLSRTESGKVVDLIAGELADEFGTESVPVPDLGQGAVLLKLDAVAAIGLFDPAFTRGDVHRLDWAERARAAGYRGVLAPGAFVPGTESHPGHGEELLDLRHPGWRSRRVPPDTAVAQERAATRLVVAAARAEGYSVQASWLPQPGDGSEVQLVVRPDGRHLTVTGHAWGVDANLSLPNDANPAEALEDLIGTPPRRVTIFERGRIASRLAAATWNGDTPFVDELTYPTRV